MSRPNPHIARMAPYALASLTVPDGHRLISLSQNESLRPPSPKAVSAAAKTLAQGMLYPDPDWMDLRRALAKRHGLEPQNILCGGGSLDLINCIARVYSGPDRAVLAPAHAYPFFRTAAQMAAARFDTATETDAVVSVDALLNAVQPDTGIVFLANPGNPTGTRISKSELLRLRTGLRPDILLIIDEAYGEFADHLHEHCFDMVSTGNTVVLRTFSKAYGMAGFRVGWGYFPDQMATELRKVMNPNGISAQAQAAATVAVEDAAYMRETCALIADLRDWAATALTETGWRVYPSFTNFLLINMGSPEVAQCVDAKLRQQGIFLRPQAGAGLPHTLRMTIGAKPDLEVAVEALVELSKEFPV